MFGHLASVGQTVAVLLADKQTFPKLDTVGWYSTGSDVDEGDMQIHKMVIPVPVKPRCCAT